MAEVSSALREHIANLNTNVQHYSAFHILRHPGINTTKLLPIVPDLADVDPQLLSRIDIEGTYYPHLTRQDADVRAFMEDESLLLDPSMEYSSVPGLSHEVVEKLYRVRPTTIVSRSASFATVASTQNIS